MGEAEIQRCGRGHGLRLLVLAILLGVPVAARAAEAPAAALPESIACETTKYLIGLRQQGLFYLQAEYMKTCLPKGMAEQAWYQREQVLARALQAESIDARLPLLGQADDAAARAIEAEGRAAERAGAVASPRSVLWRADRADVVLPGESAAVRAGAVLRADASGAEGSEGVGGARRPGL